MIKNTLALGQDSRDRPLSLSAIMVRDWDSAVPAGLVVPDLPGQLGSKEMGKISNKPGREAEHGRPKRNHLGMLSTDAYDLVIMKTAFSSLFGNPIY